VVFNDSHERKEIVSTTLRANLTKIFTSLFLGEGVVCSVVELFGRRRQG